VRITRVINFKVTEDAEGRDIMSALDITRNTRSSDAFLHKVSGRVTLLGAATHVVNLTGITAVRGFYVKGLDGNVNVVINGAAALQVQRASEAAGVPCEIGGEAVITSLSIVNPAATAELNVYFLLYGDVAA